MQKNMGNLQKKAIFLPPCPLMGYWTQKKAVLALYKSTITVLNVLNPFMVFPLAIKKNRRTRS